jgi:predicted ATP-dependent endonuclease of OLD family
MQRIEVKNFGPLKDVSLDIKDYMIFIGPQASGKSTLAKLVYAYYNFKDVLHTWYFYASTSDFPTYKTPDSIIEKVQHLLFKNFDVIGDSYNIKFIFGDNKWVIFFKNGFELSDSFSLFLNKLYTYSHSEQSKFNNDLSFDERSFNKELFNKSVRNIINDFFDQSQLEYNFIPAGRSAFSIVSGILNDPLPNSKWSDINYSRFSRLIRDISEELLNEKKNKINNVELDNLFKNLSSNILKGEPKFETNHDDLLNLKDIIPKLSTFFGKLDLRNTSSGQQETFWIIIILNYFLSAKRAVSLIIEEPEAHLFPEAQRDLTYLISLLANQQGNQVLLTTHSPYILASLNNLLKAYTVGQLEQNKEAVGKIIDPLLWVNPERVYVGYMENGEIRPILNPELQQIEHDLLDNVSNDIMTKFDELLDIQYNQ